MRVRRSAEAAKDVEEVVKYYSRQDLSLANRFIRKYEASLRIIKEMPGTGSLRFANQLDIPDVRAYPMQDFPYIVFYRAHKDAIDIDRVLHSHRDTFSILLGYQ